MGLMLHRPAASVLTALGWGQEAGWSSSTWLWPPPRWPQSAHLQNERVAFHW